jgi:thymidylate kinase
MQLAKQRGHLNEIEDQVLNEWYEDIIQRFGIKLDLIIYLDTPPYVAMQRVRERDRAGESTLNLDDMMEMERMYQFWLNKASCPVIRIRAQTREEMKKEAKKLQEYIIKYFGYTYK